MSASAWPFSDSSDDGSLNLSGFSAEELNQAREDFVRGSRDTDSDLSIEDYASSEERESDSEESLTDKEIKETIEKKIRESDNLEATSNVPVYLWIICSIFQYDHKIPADRTLYLDSWYLFEGTFQRIKP